MSSKRRDISTRAAWVWLGVLIAMQYCLFRTYMMRELVWAHPLAHDQTSYLADSYEILTRMLDDGFWRGFLFGLEFGSPNGVFLIVQNAVASLFAGSGRMTAVTLNFIYFAGAEIVLAWTIRKLTSSWTWALCGVALLTLSVSRLRDVGGLHDFRIDSIAASIYGIVVCLFLLTDRFSSRLFSVYFGLASAVLIGFRFLTAAYLSVFYAVALAVLLSEYRKLTREERDGWRLRFRNYWTSVAMVVIIALPLLLSHWTVLTAYYWFGHFNTKEKELRAAMEGVSGSMDALLYYPKSLALVHLGAPYILGVLLFIVGAWLLRQTRSAQSRSLGGSIAAVTAAVLIPILILSTDQLKSPIVVSIVVIPLTLLIVLVTAMTFRTDHLPKVAVAVLVACALGAEISASSRHSGTEKYRENEEQLMQFYDTVFDYSQRAGWREPTIFFDRSPDYLAARMARTIIFERKAVLMQVHSTFGVQIFEPAREDVSKGIAAAHFAVISSAGAGREGSINLPYEQFMKSLQPELMSEARKRMVELGTYRYANHEFTLFARPNIEVTGASGEWFLSEGAGLQIPCRMLGKQKRLTFGGKTIGFEYLKGTPGIHAWYGSPSGKVELPASVPELGGHYQIQLDFSKIDLPEKGYCPVSMTFDHYFIPEEINHTPDKRKLVIFAPTEFQFE